jgi:hypothetical protein
LVVFVEEDVAASKIWQETEDGEAGGFQFFPSDVLVLVLKSPKSRVLRVCR